MMFMMFIPSWFSVTAVYYVTGASLSASTSVAILFIHKNLCSYVELQHHSDVRLLYLFAPDLNDWLGSLSALWCVNINWAPCMYISITLSTALHATHSPDCIVHHMTDQVFLLKRWVSMQCSENFVLLWIILILIIFALAVHILNLSNPLHSPTEIQFIWQDAVITLLSV